VPTLDLHVDDADLLDLRRRVEQTRWPVHWPTPPWEAGTDAGELRRLSGYWADGYDWRAAERRINRLPSFEADIGGRRLHYLKFDGERPDAVPIVLTNGWPSTFLEMVGLAERLSRPSEYDADPDLCFTVVVPSLPGFTFSEQRPTLPADLATAEIWHQLMTRLLGFEKYFAHGGDLGAGITSRLGVAHPEALLGLHLMAVAAPADLDDSTLTDDEREYLDRGAQWSREEGAYLHQQSTRPLTLAYALSDSPVGLLGWILEKYRAWSDSGGRLSTRFTDDFLLTQASLYWFTNTIGTSFRPYYEYGRGVDRALPRVAVPTAVALFPADLVQPPRSWAERTYDVVRYTTMPSGGHFAPVEEPALLARDIAEFVAGLRLHGATRSVDDLLQ
jgi:pimeloyl-ACP methyl ester carboxylesterase